jgi:hypothetical protein
MYLLSRSLEFTPVGALVASLCFTFNGLMMATIYDGQMFRIQAFTWLPACLYLLKQALTSKTVVFYGTMAGCLWGIQLLSGAPQDAFYTFLCAFLFALVMADWGSGRIPVLLRVSLILALFFFTGLGIAAVQLIPALEFTQESVRAAITDYSLLTLGSYPPKGIITAALPHFFGHFQLNDYWVSDVPWSVPLYNLYVGILPLMLLFFIPYRESANRRILGFALSLVALAFLLALGSNTPVYKLTALLPGFDKIRAPAKILILWVLGMSLLAGKGADSVFGLPKMFLWRRFAVAFVILFASVALAITFILQPPLVLKVFFPFILNQAIPALMERAQGLMIEEFHRFTLISGLCLMVIFLSIRSSLGRPLAAAFLCGILFVDLAYVNDGAIRHDDRIYAEAGRVKKDLADTLGQDESIFRVGSFRSGWGANFEMYLGYQTVGGYTPFFLQRYYEYANQYRFSGQMIPEGWIVFFYEKRENEVLMDLLNVKYEISHRTKTYSLRETALPRGFLVPHGHALPKEQVLPYLCKPGFNPEQEIVVEAETPSDVLLRQPETPPPHPGQVTVTSYRPDRMTFLVLAEEPCFLFISETHYPGWKAFIDGQPTRILRGNYLFRVIEMPRGRHNIEFVYTPFTIKIGIGVSALTLALILYSGISASRRRASLLRGQPLVSAKNVSDS